MAILTSSQLAFVDVTDQKKISAYITSNLTTVQIYDTDGNKFNPDWKETNLILTPNVFLDQTAVSLSDPNLSVTWNKKDGNGVEVEIIPSLDESVMDNVLTIKNNSLGSSTSNMLTYICYVKYTDPKLEQTSTISSQMTYTLIRTTSNSSVSAEYLTLGASSQIFHSNDGVNYTPSEIHIEANITEGLLPDNNQWFYSVDGGANFIDANQCNEFDLVINPLKTTLTLPAASSLFNDSVRSLVFRCANGKHYDTITISKLADGQSASATYTVLLSNETQNIPTDADLYPLGDITYTCNVVVYENSNQLAATNGEPTEGEFRIILPESPAGILVEKSNPSTVTMTVNKNNPIVNAGGEIPFVIEIESIANKITKVVSYAVSKAGAPGASPVVFTVYAPNGTVFANQEGTLLLATSKYHGSSEITDGATFQWAKYASGKWVEISDAKADTYEVVGTDVVNIGSYRCIMSYNGEDYVDVITIEDKSDPLISEMFTVGGTTFKNGQGGSGVYMIIRSNGKEVDPFPTGKLPGVGQPPDTNLSLDYYYEVNHTEKKITQHVYNGTSWSEADIPQIYKYEWSLMDKDGNVSTFNNGDSVRYGKVIYLSCDDINSIGTLYCSVSKNV